MQAIALMGRLAELRPKLFSSFREDKVKDSMDFWDSLVVDPIDLVHSLVMSSECPTFLDKQTQKISTNSTIILTFCPKNLDQDLLVAARKAQHQCEANGLDLRHLH